jgi:outer membrane lipoprotein carrier protein
MLMHKTLATFLIAACAVSARAGGLESLENFMRTAKTGRAEFTQVVTAPPRDGQAARTKTSTGSFEFARPNRFRFAYAKPFQQVIVADGKTLWLYDVDLNQVTQQSQQKILGATPAALIASEADLAALKKDFDLQELPEANGLQWVQATPKQKDGQLRAVKIGFRGNDLAALDIQDGFGQRSQISFSKVELNAPVPEETFRFRAPNGADIVKQ